MKCVGILWFLLTLTVVLGMKFSNHLHEENDIPSDVEITKIDSGEQRPRHKRFLNQFGPNCHGQHPKTLYGLDMGRYIKVCEERDTIIRTIIRCSNFSFTSPRLTVCMCCPWVNGPTIRMDDPNCVCTRIHE